MAPIVPPRKRRSELGTSPAKKRPALSSTAKASSTQGKTIKRVTKPLSNCGFSCKKRHKYDVGTKILLDDSIYKGKVPADVRGHLFVYEIKDLKDGGKFVTIEYKNLVIKDGADDFHQYLESKEAQYMDFPVDQVKDAHDRWLASWYRSNQKAEEERLRLLKEQAVEVPDDEEEADLKDIDALFGEKNRGPHMLELDFEPATEGPTVYESNRTDNELTTHWQWKHKLTGRIVKRYPRPNGTKGWDTGCLATYLRAIRSDKHKIAYQRARHILKLNSKIAIGPKIPGEEARSDRVGLLRQWVSDR